MITVDRCLFYDFHRSEKVSSIINTLRNLKDSLEKFGRNQHFYEAKIGYYPVMMWLSSENGLINNYKLVRNFLNQLYKIKL